MIAANVSAARFLGRQKLPTLYRVHDQPTAEKFTDLKAFLATFGVPFPRVKDIKPRHFARVLAQVRGKPHDNLVETVLLRSMSRAVYQPDNLGHFGLALDEYAHFTSPIRRYPDLLVHRAIKHALAGKKPARFEYTKKDMERLGEHCSMTGKRADEATRDAIAWLKCDFMLDKIGDEFDGVITGVTNFGVFVQLEDVFVEGLVCAWSMWTWSSAASTSNRLRRKHDDEGSEPRSRRPPRNRLARGPKDPGASRDAARSDRRGPHFGVATVRLRWHRAAHRRWSPIQGTGWARPHGVPRL
jgi:VacB/RNase II family 3'-5' exoribonuclease